MTLTIDGKTTYYDTKEDYERAVQREAKRLGYHKSVLQTLHSPHFLISTL